MALAPDPGGKGVRTMASRYGWRPLATWRDEVLQTLVLISPEASRLYHMQSEELFAKIEKSQNRPDSVGHDPDDGSRLDSEPLWPL